MELTENEALLGDLAQSRSALLAALSDVPEEWEGTAPGEGRWSVRECVEHLATAESYLLSQILAATDAGTHTINREREAKLRAVAPNRSRRISAPESALPKGRCATLRQATEEFLDA